MFNKILFTGVFYKYYFSLFSCCPSISHQFLSARPLHLCINKNYELCCGLSYNLFYELLLVLFIHGIE